MSVRRLAPQDVQPTGFAFTQQNQDWVDKQIAKYPPGRQASAVISLLWKAQEQEGWVSRAAIEAIAGRLGMANIRVLEIATFYTMFNLEPVGKYFVQLCGTTPCMLRGAQDLRTALEKRIGPQRHVTADGNFSWLEVECLGACCNAPMVQINSDYYEDLTPEILDKLLDDLAAGREVTPGPQNGRVGSAPEGGPDTLLDPALYDGSMIGAWKQRFAEEAAKKAAAEQQAKAEAEAKAPAAPAPKPAPAAPAPAPAATAPAPAATAPAPAAPAPAAAAPKPEVSPPAAPSPKPQAAAPAPPPPAPKSEAPASPAPKAAEAATPAAPAQSEPAPVADEYKPDLLKEARGGKRDDLQQIRGIGPKLAAMLNDLGVYHFDQIAGWNDQNLAWVDQHLGSFRGRAVRDNWIDQAARLARGERPDESSGSK